MLQLVSSMLSRWQSLCVLRCICLLLDLRPCQVPTRTTVPPLFNRSDLPRKLVQLSKKHFILWAPLRHSVKTVCYVPHHHIKRARDRAYYIVWHCTCKFTHLFNPKDTHQRWTEHITLSVDVSDCACLCVIHIPDCHSSRVSPAWDAGHASKMNWTHYIVCRCEWLCMSVCDPYTRLPSIQSVPCLRRWTCIKDELNTLHCL